MKRCQEYIRVATGTGGPNAAGKRGASKHVIGLTMFLAMAVVGCGKGPAFVPVTGTVKFADGSVPKGKAGSITFQPAAGVAGTKGASALIEEDGSFTLRTTKAGDGAMPGDYAVTVNVMDSYPRGKSLVAAKFTKVNETPLKATVSSSGENHFDFVVEKP